MNTMFRMMELNYEGFYCSQILLILALEAQGKTNPDLVRSVAGLAFGAGGEHGPCGTLTGAACLLSLYAGRGASEETEHPELQSMLRELWEWFELTVGARHGGVTCEEIVGDGTEKKRRCGVIVSETFTKASEILEAHGFDLRTPYAAPLRLD